MKRVAIVGTGLIGGAVGMALRRVGIEVRGFDRDAVIMARAKEDGAIDDGAATLAEAAADVDVLLVAVPVADVPAVTIEALDAGVCAVTDVGSVKTPLVSAIEQARPDLAKYFVGGHPMAGSEQDGLDGADPDLFLGATWVLTPTEGTASTAFRTVRALVAALGAEVMAVTPEQHDELVALVSHVPQLASSTLMDLATRGSDKEAPVLRLAAGGFRDMTRVAAGHPGIWPDICVANRDAIVAALDGYMESLRAVRTLVVNSDRDGLLTMLERARTSRRSLPVGVSTGDGLLELRVPVPDRPGVLADITTLAGQRGINIADLEIAHSMESSSGVLVLIVKDGADVRGFEAALADRGYHCSRALLS